MCHRGENTASRCMIFNIKAIYSTWDFFYSPTSGSVRCSAVHKSKQTQHGRLCTMQQCSYQGKKRRHPSLYCLYSSSCPSCPPWLKKIPSTRHPSVTNGQSFFSLMSDKVFSSLFFLFIFPPQPFISTYHTFYFFFFQSDCLVPTFLCRLFISRESVQ